MMKLLEKGLVSLDDPVDKYLPGTCNSHGRKSPTVKELLNMTAGIPHGWISLDQGYNSTPLTNDGFLDLYAMSVFPEGIYEYSNYSFGIIEAVIEQLTQTSFDQAMKEELFEPLGMNNSFISLDSEDRNMEKDNAEDNRLSSTFFPSGAAGVHSTLSDLVQYAQLHLGGMDPSILSRPSLHSLHYEKIYSSTITSLGWGSISLDDSLTWLISNGSFPESANSNLTIIPSENIAVICLANRDFQSSADLMAVQIADVLVPGFADKAFGVIQAFEEADRGELVMDGSEFTSWEGFIKTGDSDSPIEITFKRDSLFVSMDQVTWQPVTNLSLDHQSIIRGNVTLSLENPISKQTTSCDGSLNLLFRDHMMQGYFSAYFEEEDQYYVALPFYIKVRGKV
jgi:CubicO group peptidase (beta-lactamase class C family)